MKNMHEKDQEVVAFCPVDDGESHIGFFKGLAWGLLLCMSLWGIITLVCYVVKTKFMS